MFLACNVDGINTKYEDLSLYYFSFYLKVGGNLNALHMYMHALLYGSFTTELLKGNSNMDLSLVWYSD